MAAALRPVEGERGQGNSGRNQSDPQGSAMSVVYPEKDAREEGRRARIPE